MTLAECAPAQMLGYEQRIDAFDETLQFGEMLLAQPIRRAERQAHAVQAQRIIAPHVLEHVQVVAAGAEIIFAVHFQPADASAGLRENGGNARRANLCQREMGAGMVTSSTSRRAAPGTCDTYQLILPVAQSRARQKIAAI